MKDNRKVVYWLFTGCLLIFIMVVVGGITRLTNSGLSISDYRLITGTIPPLNQEQWEEAFELYKQYPEYQKLHYHFTLEDFKGIYFWEWIHRVIGRFIGLVFIIPFLFFLITRQLSRSTIKKCLVLLALGAFQGFMGWYMVKSGLVDRPSVSHYRLAAHLMIAFITFAYTFWVAMDLLYPKKKPVDSGMKRWLWAAMIVLLLQITWGAFVAGLDAGWIHNTWPTMTGGDWIHETVYIEQSPLWRNFIEGKSGVQFIHRYLAYVVVGMILYIWYRTRNMALTLPQRRSIHWMLGLVFLQFVLGVLTLIYAVPLWLGVAHQVGAFFLLTAMTFSLHRFSR